MITKSIIGQILIKLSAINKDLAIKTNSKIDSKILAEELHSSFKDYSIRDFYYMLKQWIIDKGNMPTTGELKKRIDSYITYKHIAYANLPELTIEKEIEYEYISNTEKSLIKQWEQEEIKKLGGSNAGSTDSK